MGREGITLKKAFLPEQPIIRPPSEWKSMLVRLTRGCRWNRCKFCGIYPHMGQVNFSVRSVDEVKNDIDILTSLRPKAKNAFFGDADPLEAGIDAFCELARYLRQKHPIKRLTCYARASTLYKLHESAVQQLSRCGLDRVHMGLESGDGATLRFQRKGQSPEMVIQVADWLQKAGIETSFYVLLGLAGKDTWQQHILETARVLNKIKPDFIRVRRLWLYTTDSGSKGPECPLWKEIRAGNFIAQTPEGTVHELRLLIEKLWPVSTFFACDHENNFVKVAGVLRDDKEDMLAEIDDFLSLPPHIRQAHYEQVGSRI